MMVTDVATGKTDADEMLVPVYAALISIGEEDERLIESVLND